MEKKKRLTKRIIALIVAGAVILALGLTVLGFFSAYWICDATAYVWHPGYEKISESQLRELYDRAANGTASGEDFKTLFEQTGLTEIGINRALSRKNGFIRVKEIQENVFREREVINSYFAPLICTDHIADTSLEIFLEKGDILITSSTHFAGFRIGHSGICVNPDSYTPIWQATAVGTENGFATVDEGFTDRINFMVVRIKPEVFGAESVYDEKYIQCINDAAYFATNDLRDSVYSPFTGIFTSKDKCKKTSCSHLIWYCFKHFDDKNGGGRNIDLDPNGGLLVTPKDISRSPLVELVQTFGFDPEKMYE